MDVRMYDTYTCVEYGGMGVCTYECMIHTCTCAECGGMDV